MYGLLSVGEWPLRFDLVIASITSFKGAIAEKRALQRLTDVIQVPDKEMLLVDVLGWVALLLSELIQIQ